MISKTVSAAHYRHHLLTVLFLIITALLSQLAIHYNYRVDITQSQRHSLSLAGQQYLAQLTQAVTIYVFIHPKHRAINTFKSELKQYQQYTDVLTVQWINPQQSPDLVRQYHIQQQGEIVLVQGKNVHHLTTLSEKAMLRGLAAISQETLAHLTFITGYGERQPMGKANFDLGLWSEALIEQGANIAQYSIKDKTAIPANTELLIIAGSQQQWNESSQKKLLNYLEQGGHLLWLTEPNQPLPFLSQYLGLIEHPGILLDPTVAQLNINSTDFTLIEDYPIHPITKQLIAPILLPKAAALSVNQTSSGWTYFPLLTSAKQVKRHDKQTITSGPFHLAYAITRDQHSQQQRVVIIGDGDFLSNQFLSNGAHQPFGQYILHWLSTIPMPTLTVPPALDHMLLLDNTTLILIGTSFLVVLPLIWAVIGLLLFWSRRAR